MKREYFNRFILGFLFLCFMVPAQAQMVVGGTKNPENYSVLEVTADQKAGGLRLPQLTSAQRDALVTAAFKASSKSIGLLIYNTSTNNIECWNGTRWTAFKTDDLKVSRIDCDAVDFRPPFPVSGSSYTTTISIPYTDGNGVAYPQSDDIPSTGITGLKAVLAAGTLNKNGGNLDFTITGTAVYDGTSKTADFALVFGSSLCNQKLPVIGVKSFSPGFRLTDYLVSNNDINNIQLKVPYTVGSGASYPSQTFTSTGITGVSAFLQDGSLKELADDSLTFDLSGKAQYDGTAATASVNVNFGGKTQAYQLPVVGVTDITESGFTISTDNWESGKAATGTLTIPYVKGSGAKYPSQTITSTDIQGVTITLRPGTLNSLSNGTLTFDVSGEPNFNGKDTTANFIINFGGVSKTVKIPVIGVNALDSLNRFYKPAYIISAKNYSSAYLSIPYSYGTGASYSSRSFSSNGISGLTATLAAGKLASVKDDSLRFTLSGTPVYDGTHTTADFSIDFGGKFCTTSVPVVGVTALDGLNATYDSQFIFTGDTLNFQLYLPYSKGSGAMYAADSISSTGVTGLKMKIPSGQLANLDDGKLIYTVSGTPVYDGTNPTANFAVEFGGKSTTVKLPVTAVSSMVSQTYKPQGVYAVNNTSLTDSIDVQYTMGSGGYYPADTIGIQSTGVTGLTLYRKAGQLAANAGGTIRYYIKGTPRYDGTTTNAVFALSFAGKTCTITVPVLGVTALSPTTSPYTVNSVSVAAVNTAFTGSVTIPYTKGSGLAYIADDTGLQSSGIEGMLLKRTAGTLANLADGTLAYNVSGAPTAIPVISDSTATAASFFVDFGGAACVVNVPVVVKVDSFNLATATFNPAPPAKINAGYTGRLTLPYVNGSGAAYGATSYASKQITGLTAALPAGRLVTNGPGNLVLDITGTPTGYDGTSGTANFDIAFGGDTITAQLPVLAVTSLTFDNANLGGGITSGTSNKYAVAGTAYSAANSNVITLSIPYTKGSGASYPSATLTSTGVTGLTATLPAGTLANLADGTLTYSITGTPVYNGTSTAATFTISFGGQVCTVTIPVLGMTTLNGVTQSSQVNVSPTNWTRTDFDVNVTVSIPYTKGSGVSYPAQTFTRLTGNTGYTVTLEAGTLASLASGNITLKITGTSTPLSTMTFSTTFAGFSIKLTVTSATCDGYLSRGGAYTYNSNKTNFGDEAIPGPFLIADKKTEFMGSFTATGDDLCWYKTNGPSSTFNVASNYCTSTNALYTDGIAGWRLPTLPEMMVAYTSLVAGSSDKDATSGTNVATGTFWLDTNVFAPIVVGSPLTNTAWTATLTSVAANSTIKNGQKTNLSPAQFRCVKQVKLEWVSKTP